MAVSVTKRPIGVKLGACVSATIDEDYTGYATVNKTSHGLTDGDWVYVSSNVENYNGFWPVDVIDGHHFFLLQYPGGPRVAYIADATITYCPEESTHGWSCVHLPIIYQLSNTKWPTNFEDTARTVSSFTDDNGYVNLNLSGALKATVYALDYVKISGATNEALNGAFQIITAVSSSDVTIDLVYDSGYSFAGATVQFYYNSYHLKVKVYGGLPASHPWVAEKPYEVLTTLKFIPDTDNKATFSINEILKAQITTRNNPLLGTLPNNLDFFTGFYISYAEGYDTSDGTDITAYTASYADDSAYFEGNATNAKLPFKNQYSGYLTEYLDQFLTLFDTPVLFPDNYFDLSFINPSSEPFTIRTTIYYTNNTTYVLNDNYTGGRGLYRIPISAGSDETQRCIEVFGQDPFEPARLANLDQWANVAGVGPDWTAGTIPNVDFVSAVGGTSDPYYTAYSFEAGRDYVFGYSFYYNGVPATFKIIIYSAGMVVLTSTDIAVSGVTPTTGQYSYTAASGAVGIGIRVVDSSNSGEVATIESFVNLTEQTEIPLNIASLCCSVNNDCSNQNLYLTWLNYLGGFDYWNFTAQKEYNVSVGDVQTLKTNIFPSWPNSYGSFADTITKETMRESKNQIVVRSQYLTLAQLQAIKHIRTSPVVQIVTSRQDRRTVLVDTDSFRIYDEADKLYSISFTITYTDDIPSQSV